MKITYIANIRVPTEKAHGYQICKMAESLAEAGHDVELIVPRRLNNIKQNLFDYYGIKQNFKIVKLPTIDSIEFGRLGFWIQTISFNFFVLFHLIFKESDIIYSRDEFSIWLLTFFNIGKTKLFWESHTPKQNFLAKRVLEKTSKVVTITSGLRDFYIKTFQTNADKFVVAPSGIDLKNFETVISKPEIRKNLGLPQDKKIIEYVGKYKTMGKDKGVSEIISAFSKLLKEQKNIFLLLVGMDGKEQKQLELFFDGLKIKKSDYEIVPHIFQKQMKFFLKSADALVMNYPDTEHYGKYMSPVKMFEYMASGVPIVSTDLSSIREVLNDDNAALTPVGCVGEGIKKVLDDQTLADKISAKALEDVKKYSWQKRVEIIFS